MNPHTIKYNDNIDLLTTCTKHGKLEENQWYALMVTDQYQGGHDKRVFFNKSKQWLGLERTSEHKIYISKDFRKRRSVHRGITMIVEVKDTSKCYILGED